MKHDLIERYIYAATKRLPAKSREDVSMELRGLIDDMLTERCGDETPTEKDIRVVLTELGTPMEVYSKYDEDADKCLIGQPYYSTYKFVLKIVLASVVVGMTIVSLIQAIVDPTIWYDMISDWVSDLSGSLMTAFAFVTILFAFFQDKGIKLDKTFDLNELPTVPNKKQEISKIDPVVGLVIDILFVILFLAAPHMLGAVNTQTGVIVPIFNVDVIRAHWYIIVLFALFGIVRETVKLLEGRYNNKVMGTTVVIRHEDGYTTKYSCLAQEVMVAAGDIVTMGQQIGCVGTTALLESALDPHVHFSVTCDNEVVDPAEFLELG